MKNNDELNMFFQNSDEVILMNNETMEFPIDGCDVIDFIKTEKNYSDELGKDYYDAIVVVNKYNNKTMTLIPCNCFYVLSVEEDEMHHKSIVLDNIKSIDNVIKLYSSMIRG